MRRNNFYTEDSARTAEINMAPLIDIVFLLLIFFYGHNGVCRRDRGRGAKT